MRSKYAALLLDLDGTLLEIDMEIFIPVYVQALAPAFAAFTEKETFARHLLGATRVMIENTDPERTNEEVFFAEFCRRLGRAREEVAPVFDRFYREEYPKLQKWSRPRQAARPVLQAARQAGLAVVLATNPVFPRIAIEQRLAWGGLDRSDFDFITTIENMHFCKPRPGYYREAAASVGCSPAQCLMAGNDVRDDLCAAKTGMDTFLVVDHLVNSGGVPVESRYRGTLKDLAGFLRALADGTLHD